MRGAAEAAARAWSSGVGKVTARQSSASPPPARVLVEGDEADLRVAFATIAPLQPIEWCDEGLLCSPRAAPEDAAGALEACTLPVRAVQGPPLFPTPPSAWMAGWYRRSPDHAPAPPGVPELVQVDGEGFGLGDHATTELCLEALAAMPDGPAVDAGCGSGLLAQAWAASGRGTVLAVDLDPRALAQAEASARAAGCADRIAFHAGPAETLDTHELASSVLLANVPSPVHVALADRLRGATGLGAVISGVRAGEGRGIAEHYSRCGLRETGRAERDGWECLTLVAA
ncbi:MAG: 50S ribosomal protein L11 methyltransferase [Miltoncostaeaceae bacterium]